MTDENTFQEAIEAIKNGDQDRARDLLTGLLKRDKNNPEYWLWLSTVVESQKERIFCLESVLRLDPGNKAAKRGLILLGERAGGGDITPVPPVRRKWTLEPVEEPPATFLGRILANPVLRVVSILVVLLVLTGIIAAGVYGFRYTQRVTFVRVSITPRPTLTATITYTPSLTPTLVQRSSTPTYIGPIPLWTLLEATYTPTPRYVNTPHPVYEAYRSAMRAFDRGDLEQMLLFLEQASRDDPQAADFQYYIGEANLFLEQYETAGDAFQRAIAINADFGPAYTGYGKSLYMLDADEYFDTILESYETAIGLDPDFDESFIARAELFLTMDQIEDARADLEILLEKDLRDPRPYLMMAMIDLNDENIEFALANAEQAYEIDITIPEVYLILGDLYAKIGDYDAALEKLEIYLPFDESNPRVWFLLGQASYETGSPEEALQALDEAIRLDNRNGEAYWYRGRIFLDQGEGQKAVNDLYSASLLLPDTFIVSLDFARSLFGAERLEDALNQLAAAEDLVENDSQYAEVLYLRAQFLEASENLTAAVQTYTELLSLPKEAVPGQYQRYANERLLALNPPTATATSTKTLTPTSTRTPTATKTGSPTLQSTTTRTPIRSETPTVKGTP